jgi:hypothetical protein
MGMEKLEIVLRYTSDRIDPRAEAIFSRKFLDHEMKRHGIRTVGVNQLLWALRGQPMVYDPEEQKILIDPSAPIEIVRQRLNEENGFGLGLAVEEAWLFVFFHECAHADTTKSEYQCNQYAKKRIILWRRERFWKT